MRNIRIFLIALAAITLLIGSIGLGYHLYHKFNDHPESPLNAIPGNTALIIQLNQAGNLLGELNRSNLLWKSVSKFPGIQTVRNELQYLDSASRKTDQISQIFQRYKIWVAITLSGRSDFGALYLATINGKDAESGIVDFIQQISDDGIVVTKSPYSTTTLYRAQSKSGRQPFFFAIMKGVFTGSYHANLVKRSIDRLSLNTPVAASAGFKKVAATIGQKADANIYINYRFFSLVLSTITQEEILPELIRFSGFADWSGLDLIIKKDELLFNGITVASDSSQHFLSLFSDQEPGKMNICEIVPSNALFFTAFSWSNPSAFSSHYQTRAYNSENFSVYQDLINTIVDHHSLNINEYFMPWMGSEACVFGLSDPASNSSKKAMAVATTDSLKTITALKALSDSIGIKTEAIGYRGFKVFRAALPPFFAALFGELFGKVKINYYLVFNGYLLCAEDPETLQMVIDQVAGGNTLGQNKKYRDFSVNLPDQYNVFSYYNTHISIPSIKKVLNQALYQQLNPMLDSLEKIESVAFQFSNTEGLFYSNFFLRYNPNNDNEGPLLWQAALDTTILMAPKMISLTPHAGKVILVTDINQKLYMVDNGGVIAWKLPVMGRILGQIHPVHLPGSDSAYLLFNTDTHLYLLKADGSYADKFPMRFPLKATNGLAVVSSGTGSSLQVLVAFQDNVLYRFDLDGHAVQEWKRPSLPEKIVQPVSILSLERQQYFAIVGQSGKTTIANHEGGFGITLSPGFVNAPASRLYPNKTNRKGAFLTTSPEGKLVFIQRNGTATSVTLNLFTPDHRFFYADITGNGQPEFIFADRNQIFYYNRNYKLTYSYAFRREIRNEPFLLTGSNGKVMVGFVVPETNELFLFDNNGYHELESGIRGNTAYDIGVLSPGGQQCLIVGSGNWVKNYRLSQF